MDWPTIRAGSNGMTREQPEKHNGLPKRERSSRCATGSVGRRTILFLARHQERADFFEQLSAAMLGAIKVHEVCCLGEDDNFNARRMHQMPREQLTVFRSRPEVEL